jgi:hypothetical protein
MCSAGRLATGLPPSNATVQPVLGFRRRIIVSNAKARLTSVRSPGRTERRDAVSIPQSCSTTLSKELLILSGSSPLYSMKPAS